MYYFGISGIALITIYFINLITDKRINYAATDLKKIKIKSFIRIFFPHKKKRGLELAYFTFVWNLIVYIMLIIMVALVVITIKLSNKNMDIINYLHAFISFILLNIYAYSDNKLFKQRGQVNPRVYEDSNYIPPVKQNMSRKDLFGEDEE